MRAYMPICATKRLLPWPKDYLRDGGNMPADEEALHVTYAPKVIAMQDKHFAQVFSKSATLGPQFFGMELVMLWTAMSQLMC